MKLYYHPLSNNARLAVAVARHVGVAVDLHTVDFGKGELRSPEFLALNPTGRVPVLVDGDFVLWESNAIAQYLCELKRSDLLPTDARTRADILRWQSWNLSHFAVGTRTVAFERLIKPMMGGTPDPAQVEVGTAAFRRDAKVLDAHLSKRRYMVGDQLTLADFSLAATLAYAVPSELPLDEFPHMKSWLGRMDEVPAWRDTAPKMGK